MKGLTGTVPPGERLYELTDVIMEGYAGGAPVYDLTDVVVQGHLTSFPDPDYYRDEIFQWAVQITERIVRELVPGIAERIIREEIEKLKAATPEDEL